MGSARPLTPSFRRVARLAGLAIISVAAVVAAAYFLLPLAVQGFVRLLDYTLNACVWLAASLSNGADGWTILAAVGRSAAEMLLSTRALTVVGGLVLVGATALYGLQRLLGSEESSR
jgi:hypothetical protein